MYREDGAFITTPAAEPEPCVPEPSPTRVFQLRRSRPWSAIGVLLFLGAVVLLLPILWPVPGQHWHELKEQANILYGKGLYHASERLDRQALAEADRLGPRGWEAAMCLHNLSMDLEAQGRMTSAEHAMEKAVSAGRGDRYTPREGLYADVVRLATLYLRDGKPGQAISLLQEARTLARALPPTKTRGAWADMADLALAYQGVGKEHEAEVNFEKAIAAAPTDFARDHIRAQMRAARRGSHHG